MKLIELENVSKSYRKGWLNTPVLRHISLTVYKGEFVVLKGENGAGKTTLLNIILGLLKPTKGKIQLMGLSPQEVNARVKVGAVLQETQVPRKIKVKELVRFWFNLYPQSPCAEQLLETVKLVEKKDNLVTDLSGGQKQRLYFALTLAGNPELVILDEPSRNLDKEGYEEFWKQIKLLREGGITILMVTNNQSDWQELDKLATRVVTLHALKDVKDTEQLQEEILQSVDIAESSSPIPVLKTNFWKILINQFGFESLQQWRNPLGIISSYSILALILFSSWLVLERVQSFGEKIPKSIRNKLLQEIDFLNTNPLQVILYLLGFFLLVTVLDTLCKSVAVEKVEGWYRLLKTTPCSSYSYVGAKILSWSLMSLITALIGIGFAVYGFNISLDLTTSITLAVGLLLSMLPVALLGIGLGNVINARSGALSSVILLGIIPLYGTIQLASGELGQLLADVIVILPFYHSREFLLQLAGISFDGLMLLHVGWMVWGCLAFGLFSFWAYELE